MHTHIHTLTPVHIYSCTCNAHIYSSVEVYAFDLTHMEPSLLLDKQLGESVTSMGSGHILQGDANDVVVSTYSGKIIAFSSASDAEVRVWRW